MKTFQVFRYLKKWMPLIILFFVVMTVVSYRFLAGQQKYTASAVIRYNNEEAVNGLAPDKTEIDVTEISSSDNIAKAMSNLNLNTNDYSVEELCASIETSPILQEETVVIQTALNESGERYMEKPTEYLVTCTLGNDADEDFVRNFLSEVLDVYFAEYSNEHINNSQISNDVKGIVAKNYDYLELVETVRDELSETINELGDYIKADTHFRSTRTGYSFLDIQKQFKLLQDVNLYRLYSLILGNQSTRDEEFLVARYLDRIAEYSLDGRKAKEKLDDSNEIINSYVEKMRQSGNTNIDFNYILDEVYDKDKDDGSETTNSNRFTDVDRSVEYDTLLANWVEATDDLAYSLIDEAYCRYILEIYQSKDGTMPDVEGILAELEKNAEGISDDQQQESTESSEVQGEEVLPEEAAEVPSDVESAEHQTMSKVVLGRSASAEEIEGEIEQLLIRMNELYEIADETSAEYNEYMGASNIQTLTSVSASAALNLKLYVSLIAAVFLIIGCCGAILLGRIGDILEYVFLRDSQTGCMNRVACDNYIQSMSQKILPSTFCCVNLLLQDQQKLNAAIGRDKADAVLAQMGQVLKEMFGSQNNSFIGYNGGGQFWAFFENSTGEQLEQEMERFIIVMRDRIGEYPVSYALGNVNAGEASDYQIRSLISKSVTSRKQHTTNPEKKQD